jgi:hypothetical protein
VVAGPALTMKKSKLDDEIRQRKATLKELADAIDAAFEGEESGDPRPAYYLINRHGKRVFLFMGSFQWGRDLLTIMGWPLP